VTTTWTTHREPSPILHRHPLDQHDRLFVDARLARVSLRLVPPKELEPAAVPFEQGVGFDSQQRFFSVRQAAGQRDQQATVKRCEGWVFHPAFQDNELLAQRRIFGHQFRFRSDQIGGGSLEEAAGRRFGPALQAFLSFSQDLAKNLPENT
jgi:hypothetical protein